MMHESLRNSSNSLRSTDPHSVLEAIGAGQGSGLNQSSFESIDGGPAKREPGESHAASTPEQSFPKLRVVSHDVEANHANQLREQDDILQSTIESAKQIQQLARRLRDAQDSLSEREQEFSNRKAAWQESFQKQESVINAQASQLQQQSAQVRLQQRHVMQLQTDILKSHDAAKVAISSVVTDGLGSQVDAETVRQMKILQHELGGRFDYIARRWEHLYRLLENQRVQLHATQGVDDHVRWA